VIDLLALAALFAAAWLFALRPLRGRAQLAVSAASALSCLALSLALLYRAPATYEYVVYPSPADQAGLQGPGAVTKAGAAPVASLGQLLGATLAEGTLEITASHPFARPLPGPGAAPFWRPLDSYEIEEATGGLAVLPRRPALRSFLTPLRRQATPGSIDPARVLSAAGRETPTVGALLATLRAMPKDGVLALRVAFPTPDNGVNTVFYGPHFLDQPPQPNADADETAQFQLGLSGLPLVSRGAHRAYSRWIRTLTFLDGAPLYGPRSLRAWLRAHPESAGTVIAGYDTIAGPRLGLLPRVYPGAAKTWAVGAVALFLRPVLTVPALATLARFRADLPLQLYALDDPITAPTAFFLLASLFACLTLGIAATRWWASPRARVGAALLLALLLEAGSLFVIRSF
jgi:hypothetical protein